MKKRTLKFAQLFTLYAGLIIGTSSFIAGACLTMDNPMKQNLVLLIGFGELLVIYSLISIFTTKTK